MDFRIGISFYVAISRCPFQSFMPNTSTKGFPLPSGIGKTKLLSVKYESIYMLYGFPSSS
ncbi:hypothetical protein BXU01_10175 [[Flexibacter] sp. ATCC 35103]|nr:hypothetical protein BXU01_10175 [[Flexibacter] sp. ATCC 35103]